MLNWNRLRAFGRPGFLRSTARASRVSRPRSRSLRRCVFVDLDERAGDGETQRAGLTGLAAAVDVRLHVVAAEHVGRRERLLDGRDVRRTREVVAERAAVDVPLARARLEVDAADGFFAAADRVNGLMSAMAYLPRSW